MDGDICWNSNRLITIERLPFKENKLPISVSVCSKQMEVCRFCFGLQKTTEVAVFCLRQHGDMDMETWRPLNVYTGQNPRRHVILKKNQPNAYNMLTVWKKSVCLFIPLRQLLSKGWYSFRGMLFHQINYSYSLCSLVKKFMIFKFIISKLIHKKVHTNKFQIYRKKPPQRILGWPLPSETGTFYTHLAGFLWGRHVTLGSVQYPHSTMET